MGTVSKHKTISAIVVLAVIGFIITFWVISESNLESDTIVQKDYKGSDIPIEQSRYVTDCIPAGPEDITPAIGIINQTHNFDLRECVWELRDYPISDEEWKQGFGN